jgi:hypothetical protein
LEEIGLGELGMNFKEMYSLTPRSFFNALNGSRKKEDAYSKERWIMTREIMFAVMKSAGLEEGIEKTDILPFKWEQKQLKALAEAKAKTIAEDLVRMQEFWDRQDAASNCEQSHCEERSNHTEIA